MDKDSSKGPGEQALFAGEAWFDPIETGVRGRIRGFIEELVEQELKAALGRGRYERAGGTSGHRHGHRRRQLTGSFGPVEIAVPRARLREEDGTTREWRSAVLPRYARRTRQLEALIAGAYLAGMQVVRCARTPFIQGPACCSGHWQQWRPRSLVALPSASSHATMG